MLHFIETGHYGFDERAFARFPLLTTFDSHVHAYLVGRKYGITSLQDCAIEAYLETAEHELNPGLLVHSGNQLPDFQITVPGFPIIAPPDEHASSQTITPIDRFLDSLVLLWRNTQTRHDAMRKAVLELIKHHLSKLLRVRFFVTLFQEIVGFEDDLIASLGDDGLEVSVCQAATCDRQSHIIRFGV